MLNLICTTLEDFCYFCDVHQLPLSFEISVIGQPPTSFGLPSDAIFNNHLSCNTIGNERTSC